MPDGYLIGLDYGSASARGVLIDIETGAIAATHTHPYRHDVMTKALPNGRALAPDWALQHAPDYLEAAEIILTALGRGRRVRGIGIGFTASSPLPARADGTPLSALTPNAPHAYVKLWKHHAAQPWADRINAAAPDYLEDFGGRLSSEWLLPKAAQIADEAPDVWAAADRFIEAGDWLVWRLTGQETRSLGFAAYKAQYRTGIGYPADAAPGLASKLSEPIPVGAPAGPLSPHWRALCGIEGEAIVAVAVIDSHVIMPAVGAVEPGTLVGALGTSAAYLLLDDRRRPLPPGIEGLAYGGVLPGFWCYEAGQAGFGDTLAWFVRNFPRADDVAENFARYNEAAAALRPGESGLLALDWWNGNRVPFADSRLSGLMLGFTLDTSAAQIYRALMESLCFGARGILDHLSAGGAPIDRIVLASGLAQANPLLMQMMADILGRAIAVPEIAHATAVGAAIHGAAAAGVVADFAEGARRYGAKRFMRYQPEAEAARVYEGLYGEYRALGADERVREAMRAVRTRASSIRH